MPAARPLIRIAVNVAIDGVLAAVAVPVAWWITDPAGAVPSPAFCIPFGAAVLLLAGLPFRLSQQYWRFAGLGDLLTVTASSALGAALFSAILFARGLGPPSIGFPFAHGLTLLALFGGPRVGYRWFRSREPEPGGGSRCHLGPLVGQTEDCDLFLRALVRDRRQRFRVEGLLDARRSPDGPPHPGLPHSGRHEGRRHRARAAARRRPIAGTLVMATPDMQGGALSSVVAQADRFGLRVRRAPS